MTDAAPRTARTVMVLAVSQIIGWGTTYYLPSTLVRPLQRDLGLLPEVVFGGVAIMLVVAGLAGPRVGVLIDRFGAKLAMSIGSVISAAALLVLASAQGLATYALGWAIIGLAMPFALMTAAFAQIAQVAGEGARRAMSALTLFTGFTSLLFWPLTAWLDAEIGWRSTLLIFAGLHLVVCLPLHAFALPARDAVSRSGAEPRDYESRRLGAERQGAAFTLIAVAFSAIGFISWGMALLLPELLKSLGLAAGTALMIAALTGPFQVSARFTDMMLGSRFSAVHTALVAMALMPVALVLLLFAGADPLFAVLFTFFWGSCNGLMTVTRAAVPLELFGAERFATFTGRLSLPQNLAFSASPIIFTALLERTGPYPTLYVALGFAVVAVTAMVMLARLVGREPPSSVDDGI